MSFPAAAQVGSGPASRRTLTSPGTMRRVACHAAPGSTSRSFSCTLACRSLAAHPAQRSRMYPGKGLHEVSSTACTEARESQPGTAPVRRLNCAWPRQRQQQQRVEEGGHGEPEEGGPDVPGRDASGRGISPRGLRLLLGALAAASTIGHAACPAGAEGAQTSPLQSDARSRAPVA